MSHSDKYVIAIEVRETPPLTALVQVCRDLITPTSRRPRLLRYINSLVSEGSTKYRISASDRGSPHVTIRHIEPTGPIKASVSVVEKHFVKVQNETNKDEKPKVVDHLEVTTSYVISEVENRYELSELQVEVESLSAKGNQPSGTPIKCIAMGVEELVIGEDGKARLSELSPLDEGVRLAHSPRISKSEVDYQMRLAADTPWDLLRWCNSKERGTIAMHHIPACGQYCDPRLLGILQNIIKPSHQRPGLTKLVQGSLTEGTLQKLGRDSINSVLGFANPTVTVTPAVQPAAGIRAAVEVTEVHSHVLVEKFPALLKELGLFLLSKNPKLAKQGTPQILQGLGTFIEELPLLLQYLSGLVETGSQILNKAAAHLQMSRKRVFHV
ncbi:MAG: hypothetical protein ACTJLK_00465, partial [Anaplasma sp.]